MTKHLNLNIQDQFTKELPADPIVDTNSRQVLQACFSYVNPKKTAQPELIHVSKNMLKNLGLTEADAKTEAFVKTFTGNSILPNTKPYAMCYGGHQFGRWAGQLGDGRAINLCEIEHNNNRWALQLKGAGKTPYSRTADGLAVLRSSVREYLCSEAMHYLGVPTTRALSLALTGDMVLRDILYNGNAAYEKGAVVTRVAPSFLRFGNYEILAARQDIKTLKTLVNYTIKHHFSHLGAASKETYLQFFQEVATRTLHMIIHWQRVGFVHGVMNTDNMSVLGLTIDYGPYGWLEDFNFGWTPNTTDSQHKRYRFGNQPNMGLWNLYQLANALYPLIEDATALEAILNKYKTDFELESLVMMRQKLGLQLEHDQDAQLVQDLETVLQLAETDMTIFFRNLANFKKEQPEQGSALIKDAFYEPSKITAAIKQQWVHWFEAYAKRLQKETMPHTARQEFMNTINPKYVLRNYMAQLAIDAANQGDYSLIDTFFKLLKQPYHEQPHNQQWFAKRPDWAKYKVGCSMLSCSS
ncbi:YdiU family protein [Bizionia sediminis]|uniref:Protein nucleotidyltransferase YdiU n=1 Tax=Bizionia sediminis TaxID=1737064 RepID=A0ABW5KRP6_9FLAO